MIRTGNQRARILMLYSYTMLYVDVDSDVTTLPPSDNETLPPSDKLYVDVDSDVTTLPPSDYETLPPSDNLYVDFDSDVTTLPPSDDETKHPLDLLYLDLDSDITTLPHSDDDTLPPSHVIDSLELEINSQSLQLSDTLDEVQSTLLESSTLELFVEDIPIQPYSDTPGSWISKVVQCEV
ncbi:uncharacterized protein LOC123549148 isoform X4 [Mercenaria mercenaria]|uniref:uncharacterized protein LOC123549148 isoform X4 n=1 Tax=Mercenaria mercenaria TaxID=6596 RepID=UPI001E1DDAD6|nr:uncharacterized protein LOC123549148 isoform X4 [Mercenaria mercenaria]